MSPAIAMTTNWVTLGQWHFLDLIYLTSRLLCGKTVRYAVCVTLSFWIKMGYKSNKYTNLTTGAGINKFHRILDVLTMTLYIFFVFLFFSTFSVFVFFAFSLLSVFFLFLYINLCHFLSSCLNVLIKIIYKKYCDCVLTLFYSECQILC